MGNKGKFILHRINDDLQGEDNHFVNLDPPVT